MRHPHHHITDEDLLLAADGELTSRNRADIESHLARCAPCRARCAALSAAGANAMDLCREGEPVGGPIARVRERLERRLADDSHRWHQTWTKTIFPSSNLSPGWVLLAVMLTIGLLSAIVRHDAGVLRRSLQGEDIERDSRPVSALTPGAVRHVALSEICRGTVEVPGSVPDSIRQEVLRNYGMTDVPADEYELDFLVTPELGGVADARNLWPERYSERRWNAHVKDALEHLLPQLVCNGQVDLETAQHDIAKDWVSAYKKYLGTDRPLLMHARMGGDDELKQ